jgi:chaperonin GroES
MCRADSGGSGARYVAGLQVNETNFTERNPGMKTLKITPLADHIAIEVDEAEDVSPGGIVLPDAAKNKPSRGTVVAIGRGRTLDNGELHEMELEVGDKVIFGRYAGTDVEIAGDELKLIRESDVLAKIE